MPPALVNPLAASFYYRNVITGYFMQSLTSEASDGTGITAEAISDILTDDKQRGNRASIRLTFHHTRSGTPLSRSTEDLSQANDGSSSDTLDTQSVDSKDKSNEDSDSPHETPKTNTDTNSSNTPSKSMKPVDEKRKQFALSRISISSLKSSKNDLSQTKSKPAIPLSQILQESQVASSNTNLSHLQSPPNPLNNLTWPKRGVNNPKYQKIPTSWRKTTGHMMASDAANKRKNLPLTDKMTSPTHCTQDKFIIGFKSNSMPNLLKGNFR